MGEAGRGHRFVPEAGHQRLVAGQVGMENLDRHQAVEYLVARLPYLGHPALRQRPHQSVAAHQQAFGHDVASGVGHPATVLSVV